MAKKKCGSFSLTNVFLILSLLFLLYVLIKITFFKRRNNIEGLSNDKEFVLVYMNGCGHCNRLMPEWESAAKENKSGIKMRAVEMNENDGPELCKKYNINGFPTMMVLNNGNKVNDYNGKRNKNDLLEFLNNL